MVLRLNPRGVLDHTFARRGVKEFRAGRARGMTMVGSTIGEVAIDRRGRIVVAGEAFDDDFFIREDVGKPYPAIARLKG